MAIIFLVPSDQPRRVSCLPPKLQLTSQPWQSSSLFHPINRGGFLACRQNCNSLLSHGNHLPCSIRSTEEGFLLAAKIATHFSAMAIIFLVPSDQPRRVSCLPPKLQLTSQPWQSSSLFHPINRGGFLACRQ